MWGDWKLSTTMRFTRHSFKFEQLIQKWKANLLNNVALISEDNVIWLTRKIKTFSSSWATHVRSFLANFIAEVPSFKGNPESISPQSRISDCRDMIFRRYSTGDGEQKHTHHYKRRMQLPLHLLSTLSHRQITMEDLICVDATHRK